MFITVILEGDTWTHSDLWTIMFSMLSGYMLVNAGPGAIINGWIILKELTLNQFAWSEDADYKEGVVFGLDMDMVHWILPAFGLSEDWKFYNKNLWKWGRQFL